jgi:mRNA interferase HigB
VNVISKRGLFERAAKFADAKSALQVWFDTAVEAEWRSIEDVRKSFPATDMKGDLAIFNIRGNNYRLIVRMVFQYQRIYVKEFLTHAEYDKGRWKKWL